MSRTKSIRVRNAVQAERLAEVLRIGGQMSNLCFDLSQPACPFKESHREDMLSLYRQWDEALRKLKE